MTGPELRRALKSLGWSQSRAARELAVGGGQQRISDWCRGVKPVPPYIAAHVETHTRLEIANRRLRQICGHKNGDGVQSLAASVAMGALEEQGLDHPGPRQTRDPAADRA